MGSMPIVKSNVLAKDMIRVLATEALEVAQAFTLKRTDPRFGECVRIRCLYRRSHNTDTRVIE